MRKSREEAAQTRKRIVEAAACEFRKNGIVATGLNDLMKAAGLTHGGFYKHFESKDQLVAEACAEAVEAIIGVMEAQPTTQRRRGGATYRPGTGTTRLPAARSPRSAANSPGRTRRRARRRRTASRGSSGFWRGSRTTKDARRRALVAVSTMIGAVTMSRVVTDPELSAEILSEVEKSLNG